METTCSLEGSVVVVPLPSAPCPSLGIWVTTRCNSPYPSVDRIRQDSPLLGGGLAVQQGDLLMNLGEHNLWNMSTDRVQSLLSQKSCLGGGGVMVLLRPKSSNNGVAATATPTAASLRTIVSPTAASASPPTTTTTTTASISATPLAHIHNVSMSTTAAAMATVKREPMPKTPSAGKNDDDDDSVIEILDSDDEVKQQAGLPPPLPPPTARAVKSEATPIVIGPPALFATGKARFPFTIDTGFNGNGTIAFLKFQETRLTRYAHKEAGLPLIWPPQTPIPDETGGFYEELSIIGKGNNNKRNKVARKTQSRVARLAGRIAIHVRISNASLATVCRGRLHPYDPHGARFVLAEHLWIAIQQTGEDPSAFISPKEQEILRAIMCLNDRQNTFKERCLFVVAEALPSDPPHLPCVAQLTFQVFFRRALVGLSANPNIRTLLGALEPLPHQEPWTPCRQCLPSTNRYQQSPRPQAHGFHHSLAGLLWANESTGYPLPTHRRRRRSYRGVNVKLRDYQEESVAWMQNQENRNVQETGGGVAGLNGYFWEKRTFADGEEYYFFPIGGQIVAESPPVVTGGMLAQEMGLGKTVISLELICSDVANVEKGSGGTVVIVPVSLLSQWEDEVTSKAPHLSVFKYYGEDVEQFHLQHRLNLAAELSKFDVVLTTMSKLKELTSNRPNARYQMKNCLHKVQWHRCIVDECQFIRSDTSAIARAASAITAKHIWMLSGTPLTNKLDDLRGELALLRVWPFTLGSSSDKGWRDAFWKDYINEPWDQRSGDSLPIIHSLMKAVSFRNSRLQLRLDNSPLVELPPRTEKFVAITMDSRSSYAYVTRWAAAAALQLLRGYDRFDVRISSMITKMRQLATNPGLLLDQSCLEQFDDILQDISAFAEASNVSGIKQVELLDAIKERKKEKDSPVLAELVLLAKNGLGCLTPCNFCQKARSRPAYMTCSHSLCVGCCEELLKEKGSFNCPACDARDICSDDIVEVVVPECLSQTVLPRNASASKRIIEVDLDEENIDQILVDKKLQRHVDFTSSEWEAPSSSSVPLTTYKVSYEDQFSFQMDENVTHATLDALKYHPKPHLTTELDLKTRELVAGLANVGHMTALISHAASCREDLYSSPKIRALCETIESIRSSSLEAKICVFSSFARVLDDVEEVLDNVRYTIEYDMNTNMHLHPGQRVICLTTGCKGLVVNQAKDMSQEFSTTEGLFYEVKLENGQTSVVHRDNLQVERIVVQNVPSKLVRGSPSDKKLCVNGTMDRYSVGTSVESKRPSVSSHELHVTYNVTILSADDGSQYETGRVVHVHKQANGQVFYDVQPGGYYESTTSDQTRKYILRQVPPYLLIDKGSARWLPAKIVEVYTKQSMSDDHYSEGSSTDPFEHAVGFVRLDGSAGNASRRGEILEVFKRDPMTSICLLTKASAGVGLNLTEANHVIILEPSMDAHDELQSVARIHRIGQTRKVQVLKFYTKGSLEERILLRRQQRGELTVSLNATTGGGSDVEEEDGPKEDKGSEVSSSRVLTFEDLKFLTGDTVALTNQEELED